MARKLAKYGLWELAYCCATLHLRFSEGDRTTILEGVIKQEFKKRIQDRYLHLPAEELDGYTGWPDISCMTYLRPAA